ncbi:uncharacterized protein LOC110024999 isoform X2 [Phalaenopsis equestris]|uniref:uncharacterized protein LOC110024999 isoform X2 n=1 Tax=Phalaenopsis equestris TaxID=78828 RepID=UPI0009E2EE71|nr:uncharacterized protein LOC110024999 isoform X2 [Phalaenopsis equestris]
MLLGKRPRPSMKRTTSMKNVSADLGTTVTVSTQFHPKAPATGDGNQPPWDSRDWNLDRRRNVMGASGLVSMVSPRGIRWGSAAVETAPFLRVCALCKGVLHPGRDIFMYSTECRGHQIKLDERKEKAKCSVTSRKDSTQTQANTPASKASGGGETVAAS